MLYNVVLLMGMLTSSTVYIIVSSERVHLCLSFSAAEATGKVVNVESTYQNNEGNRSNETPYEIVINVKPATIGKGRQCIK